MNISITRLRDVLVEELKDKNCEPVRLPFDEEFLNELLFNGDNELKTFAETLKQILSKIDFSNVNFDGFVSCDFDFSPYCGIKLNPQRVRRKNMTNSIFKGVEFIGPFDGVEISGSDFSGSKGAKINPQTLKAYGLCNVKCKDIEFIGNTEGEQPDFFGISISGADFNGSNYEAGIKEEEEFRQKVKQIFLTNNKPE